jgi:hypothetical protein
MHADEMHAYEMLVREARCERHSHKRQRGNVSRNHLLVRKKVASPVQARICFNLLQVLKTRDHNIYTSESGWTDNELGLVYLKKHFEPQITKTKGEQGYRILIVDGHESYIII